MEEPKPFALLRDERLFSEEHPGGPVSLSVRPTSRLRPRSPCCGSTYDNRTHWLDFLFAKNQEQSEKRCNNVLLSTHEVKDALVVVQSYYSLNKKIDD
mmetsp:Transcript_1707/g.2308  ORF Transcript_1707/g.2308 Transcript_1707/m.2308 type:complete len:98 (-) Transcript_1707:378-671(-)